MYKLGISKKKIISLISLWFGCVFLFIAVTLSILEYNERQLQNKDNDRIIEVENEVEKRYKIDLLENMNKSNYTYNDIIVTEAYIEYDSSYYSFNGIFSPKVDLKNYEFIVVLNDVNGKEVTRYIERTDEAFKNEEIMMYEEFDVDLDLVTSFTIVSK